VVGDDFAQSGGSRGDAASQEFEIVEGVPDIGRDADAVAVGFGQRVLERIE
jgi:hypothetical protein